MKEGVSVGSLGLGESSKVLVSEGGVEWWMNREFPREG